MASLYIVVQGKEGASCLQEVVGNGATSYRSPDGIHYGRMHGNSKLSMTLLSNFRHDHSNLIHSIQIQKGVSSGRSDDTKGMKGPVLDWITPRDIALQPPLSRNIKTNRGFHHPITGALLCPAGVDWNDSQYVYPAHGVFLILIRGVDFYQNSREINER